MTETTLAPRVTPKAVPAGVTADPTALGWSRPTLFILMWSSGYIAGAIGIHYAPPFLMTTLRFALAAVVLLAVALVMRAKWPATRAEFGHIVVVGVLIQAVQFGGLYSGMKLGVSAAVSALIVGTMPIWTAVFASLIFRDKIGRYQWLGLGLGLVGVALVVSNKLAAAHAAPLVGYAAVGCALFGITSGTLYQKRYCKTMDVRTGGVIQLTVATIILGILAVSTETLSVNWTWSFIGAWTWMSVINSIGAISLLFMMIRRGESTRVASLFYLIPGVTALMSAGLLHETLTLPTIIGFALAAVGVYLSTRK
jgi:drug/metabolite transporter (DMT)-like permease